ncbi:PREDICTED: adhesion G-protein coupled receptor G1 [Crocodylus porosus]|uniref:Adhesion G-protein coupled receptor G1 n=1 Tax=Crocodylus porosus TaxID=8502 RepID=A0A7M4FBW2_CROPO|nr:PREDICTED: adhesion G-protein coupled receptor G1 [Crocodylus porosus]
MNFFFLALVFLLQGINRSTSQDEDFQFCAERNQTQRSYLVGEFHKENITIDNSADKLIIKAPFIPGNTNEPLPDHLGIYHFCLYGYQRSGLFNITYGKSNYTLSRNVNSSLRSLRANPPRNSSRIPILFNVSYTYEKGQKNDLSNAVNYSFSFKGPENIDHGVQVHDIEHELSNLAKFMKNTIMPIGRTGSSRSQYKKLLHLEGKLEKVQFEGENKAFKETTISAIVWKMGPNKASQNLSFTSEWEAGKKVRGFEMNMPSVVFAKAKGRGKAAETRVLLVEINSQSLFQDKNSSRVLGEKVIGISVANTVVSHLPQNVVLTFFHDQLLRNETPQCVFWGVDANDGSGSWNDTGCTTEKGNEQTTCRCNHLTYFAVLMMSSPEIDYIHKDYLTIITYIGCIISAVASVFTIFFLRSRKKHRDHAVNISIHINLLSAIFLLDVSFLINEHLASMGSEAACKTGAIFLHFSLLSCLTWMGIEGYNLYRLVVEVFNSYFEHFILKLCLVGWGFPTFLVAMIFLTDWTNYGPFQIAVFESLDRSTNTTICWITKPLIHNMVNLGFLSLVFLFNSVMLAAMIREILRQNKRGHTSKHALTLLGLSFVLGLPWALAFFSFSSGTFQLVTIYLFTIINSLQGFLILLWYWTMVLEARKSPHSQSSSDSMKLQLNTSQTSPD